MRVDGSVTYYFIQHEDRTQSGGWCGSSLEHFLFEGMSYEDKQGALGDRRRELLEPESASSELWQEFGIHGFSFEGDARSAFAEVCKAHPDRAFRIVRRHVTQKTEVLA